MAPQLLDRRRPSWKEAPKTNITCLYRSHLLEVEKTSSKNNVNDSPLLERRPQPPGTFDLMKRQVLYKIGTNPA